ncbi:MAG: hypothetical protein OEV40_14890 [Acidimicrobiia bacterium]|nr:hypothetical protein [Acidimicrobiia bacterium]
MIVDIVREKRAYRKAKKAGVQPLGHRGGIYPLLRAATTVGLAEITWTQGATFEQRYREELAEEGWDNVNGLLADAANDDSALGKVVKRTTRRRTADDEVALGPDTERTVPAGGEDIVMLASGNLGLVSFPQIPGRASLQEVEAAHPGLIDGRRRHEGVGLILVRDEVDGDLVFRPTAPTTSPMAGWRATTRLRCSGPTPPTTSAAPAALTTALTC